MNKQKTWGKNKKTNPLPRGSHILEGEKWNARSDRGFLTKQSRELSGTEGPDGNKSAPGERTPDRSLTDRRQSQASLGRSSSGKALGLGTVRVPRKASAAGVAAGRVGTCGRPRRGARAPGSGGPRGQRGLPCFPQVGWAAAAAMGRGSVSVSEGSLRLIFRRGRFNGSPSGPWLRSL